MASGHDLTFRMKADIADFAGNMAKAKREADKLFVDTRTNAERFGMELDKLQQLSHLKMIDDSTFNRSYQGLLDRFDPFGKQAQQAESERAAAAARAKTDAIISSERRAAQMRMASADEAAQHERRVAEKLAADQARLAADKAAKVAAAYESEVAAAQRAANAVMTSTRTNSERFAMEVGNLQYLQARGGLDDESYLRAYRQLEDKYDPFGKQAQQKAAANAKERTAAIIAAERNAAKNYRSPLMMMIDQDIIDTRMDKIAARSKNAASAVAGSGTAAIRTNMAFQQLAFGLEDAASQYGTMGLSGAIRGASNNLSAAAMMLGPQAALIGALTSTVAMLGSQYWDASSKAEKLAKSQDMLAESANRLNRELDEREKNYALRFQLEDIGNMSHQNAAAVRRQSERDEETLRIRQEAIELETEQMIRRRAEEEQRRIERQQHLEGYDQNRHNRNVDLERTKRRTPRELLTTNPDQLPTGLLSEEETEKLRRNQEEHRRLQVEIGNTNAMREEASEIERRESQRAYDDAQLNNQWEIDEEKWRTATKWINEAKTVGEKFRDSLIEIARIDDPSLDKEKARQAAVRSAFGDTRTQMEKYRDTLKEIGMAEEAGGLTAQESFRLRRQAASSIAPQNLLSGAYQANSSEAYQVMGNALSTAMREQLISSFAGTSKQPDPAQQKVADNTAKGNELLGKIVSQLAQQPGISIESRGLD